MHRRGRKISSPKGKTSLDVHIGNRIRERRAALGLAGYQLAEMIGVTYGQVLKYESGTSRISAGQLYEIARALDVPTTFFFKGLDGLPAQSAAAQPQLLEFTRNFGEIQNEQYKEVLLAIVRLLADR